MRSIGIDIGSYSIKIAELMQTKKGVQITALHEHVLGQNPAFDPEFEILEILRGLAVKYDPTSTKFVVGLRQEFITQRVKTFPFTDRQKVMKSLPFEMEEETPFSIDNAVYESKAVQTMGSFSEVLAMVAPKAKIADAIARFQGYNIKVTVLSSEGMGIANLVEAWTEAPPAEPAPPASLDEENKPIRPLRLLIHIGHTRTHVSAFFKDRLVSSRTLLWGAKSVAEAISKRYEIPFVEAMKEMTTKAFVLLAKEGASYDQIIFSDTIAKQLKELTREMRLALLDVQSELSGEVTIAEITGGGAQIINLGPYLTTQLELPVNQFRWSTRFSSVAEIPVGLDFSGGLAVGLAIEGYKKPRNPALNFRRGEFALQNESSALFWETWGGTLKLGAAIFAVAFVYTNIRDSLAFSLTEVTAETLKTQAKTVAGLNPKQANEAGVRKYIKNERDRIKETQALLGVMKMSSALEVLKQLNDALPPKTELTVTVKKLFIEDEQVTFEGTVKQAGGIDRVESAARRIALGGSVQASKGAATADGQGFSMRFRVDRGIEKAADRGKGGN